MAFHLHLHDRIQMCSITRSRISIQNDKLLQVRLACLWHIAMVLNPESIRIDLVEILLVLYFNLNPFRLFGLLLPDLVKITDDLIIC